MGVDCGLGCRHSSFEGGLLPAVIVGYNVACRSGLKAHLAVVKARRAASCAARGIKQVNYRYTKRVF
jgi:hypothetical protein